MLACRAGGRHGRGALACEEARGDRRAALRFRCCFGCRDGRVRSGRRRPYSGGGVFVGSPKGTVEQCTIRGTFTVRNAGLQNAGASTLRVYLSDNKYYDPTDTLIKEYAISALNAGASARRGSRISYRLPSGSPVRPRWLIGVVDCNKVVPEVNETNNNVDYGPLYP